MKLTYSELRWKVLKFFRWVWVKRILNLAITHIKNRGLNLARKVQASSINSSLQLHYVKIITFYMIRCCQRFSNSSYFMRTSPPPPYIAYPTPFFYFLSNWLDSIKLSPSYETNNTDRNHVNDQKAHGTRREKQPLFFMGKIRTPPSKVGDVFQL